MLYMNMDKVEELATMLKACGHPLRLQILCAIERGEQACVSQLWNCLQQAQPVVSQHLAVLKRRGIVSSRVCGNRRVYAISNPFIRSLIVGLTDSVEFPGENGKGV
jgi:ArsR family transcriptional regulator